MKKRLISLCMILLLVLTAFPVQAFAAPSVKVDSLTFTQLTEDSYKISWQLSRLGGEALVRVSLSTSDHDHDVAATELGSIRSGSVGNITVTIPDVETGFYHFLVDITTMDAATGYEFSEEAIFFEDPAGADELTGIVAGRSQDKAYAVWEEETPVMFYLYDAETKELLARETSMSKPAAVSIPSGHADVILGVAAFDGNAGKFTPIYCYQKDIENVKDPFPEEDVTNQKELTITPDADEGEFRLFKNHEECRARNGSYKIALDEGENSLIAFIEQKSGVTAAIEKNILLDTEPPVLTLENTGTSVVTTKDHVFVQGYAETGALVTCDGDAVALVGDCFSIEKEIGFGSRTIKLSAADKAGNITSYNIEVTRSFWAGSGRLLILVIILAAIGAAGEIWLLFLRGKKPPKEKKK